MILFAPVFILRCLRSLLFKRSVPAKLAAKLMRKVRLESFNNR